uniref:FecR family protein n=1 Tax=uncultured Draconibacterium sp. TaxID=1573823 RepID=UPI003216EF69
MSINKNINELLANEEFQNEILNFDKLSEEKQNTIFERYSITRKEFFYAQKFFLGISFQNTDMAPEHINYALKELINKVRTDRVVSKSATGFITWVSRIAAVLSIPLLLATIYLYQKTTDLDSNHIISASSENVINTFSSPMGAKSQVALPDGSIVWLNSGSSISFPSFFDSKSRNVELKGEAYFDVTRNPDIPMIVTTSNIKIKVYGTKFNVNAFADNNTIETTLVEGKITIIPEDRNNEFLVRPQHTAFYSIIEKKLHVKKIDNVADYIGWKDGQLMFRDETFGSILKRLERWYNVEIQLTDKSLANYKLYATFFDENIEEVLNLFAKSIPIKIEYSDRVKQSNGSYTKRQIIIKRDKLKKMN